MLARPVTINRRAVRSCHCLITAADLNALHTSDRVLQCLQTRLRRQQRSSRYNSQIHCPMSVPLHHAGILIDVVYLKQLCV